MLVLLRREVLEQKLCCMTILDSCIVFSLIKGRLLFNFFEDVILRREMFRGY